MLVKGAPGIFINTMRNRILDFQLGPGIPLMDAVSESMYMGSSQNMFDLCLDNPTTMACFPFKYEQMHLCNIYYKSL